MSDVKSVTVCDECEQLRCLFDAFQEDFIGTESWATERALVESKINPGDLRQRALRKKLFMSFARFNGTIGFREKIPLCVERGVRKLFPSPFYMGFKRTRDDADNCAVDINGNKVDGIKWVQTETGKYKLQCDKNEQAGDGAWQKRSKGHVEDE